MRKCSRCGADNPPYEVLGDDERSLAPATDVWELCNDCYGKFLYIMDRFTHKTHGEIELALENTPDAWWRVRS